jgi:hypothetical protein
MIKNIWYCLFFRYPFQNIANLAVKHINNPSKGIRVYHLVWVVKQSTDNIIAYLIQNKMVPYCPTLGPKLVP